MLAAMPKLKLPAEPEAAVACIQHGVKHLDTDASATPKKMRLVSWFFGRCAFLAPDLLAALRHLNLPGRYLRGPERWHTNA